MFQLTLSDMYLQNCSKRYHTQLLPSMVSTGRLRRSLRCSARGMKMCSSRKPLLLQLTLSSDESVDAVREWLEAAGIPTDRVELTTGGNWIKFDATVDEAESLLRTKYNVYEHEAGQLHVACEE